MKQLTVISGKGGTGKTSVTAAFACLADRAVLADTDVDAADLHLILEPQVREQGTYAGGSVAQIDREACTQCNTCTDVCRFEAISEYVVDPIACEGCAFCAHVCPAGAVSMQERVSGTWFISETRRGPMVHARLGIAEDNSGKLVSLVRQKAREVAEQEGRDLVIIDGPPGIGCPVIAAITGTDLVLVVTEPTLSGLHDMERVLDTAAHFKIPAVVCVNKYDINADNTTTIEAACRTRDVPIVGRVPYDTAVTKAMIAQQSIVEYDGGGTLAATFRDVWREVETALART